MSIHITYNLADATGKRDDTMHSFSYNALPVGIAYVSSGGGLLKANRKFSEILGCSHEELTDIAAQDIIHQDDLDAHLSNIHQALHAEADISIWEARLIRKDHSAAWVKFNASKVNTQSFGPDCLVLTVEDISDRKRMDARQRLGLKILELINLPEEERVSIQKITGLIREFLGIDAVGIRFKDGDDYPYYHTSGFPEHFVTSERSLFATDEEGTIIRDSRGLAVLECMCGHVLSGSVDPSLPFFTPGGSFWTNSTTDLFSMPITEGLLGRTRNRCNAAEYESMALVPFRSKGVTTGLLQLNDTRRGAFTADDIEFFEGLGEGLGIYFQRLRAEKEIRNKEERMRLLFDSTAEGIYGIDTEGNCTFCNPAALRMLGYAHSDELVGRDMHSLIHHSHGDGSAYPAEECPIYRASANGERMHAKEEVLWRRDGSSFFAEYRSYPIRSSGEVVGSIVTFLDITERKNVSELYKSVVATTKDAFWICDSEANILDVNEAACLMYGYSREEMIGMHPRDFELVETPEDVQRHTALLKQKGGDVFESRHRTRDAREINVEISMAYLDRAGGTCFGFIRDVTDKHKARLAIANSEENLRAFFNTVDDFLFVLNMDGDIIRANEAVCRRLGYSMEDILGEPLLLLCPEEPVDAAGLSFEYALQDERETRVLAMRTRGGDRIEVERHIKKGLWDGRPAIFCVCTDITRLKQSEEKFSKTFHANPAMCSITEIETGVYVDVNDAFCRLTGYERHEAIGRSSAELGILSLEERKRILSENPPELGVKNVEATVRRKDGSPLHVELSADIVNISGRDYLFTLAHDISVRKRLEEDTIRSQKFESLGLLAGGIAHDFNNTLTIINNNVSLARMYCAKGSPVYEKLTEALEEFSQAKALTQQLLTFTTAGSAAKEPTSVGETLRHIVSFSLRGSNVKPRFNIQANCPFIEVDRGQFSQVINNIVINAMQAMPDGGSLDVSTSICEVGSREGLPVPKGRYVKISIADTGTGIPRDILGRIFDPYFTTKAEGHGFGLSSSYTIIKRHNGCITVESEQGRGSVFHVYLPAMDETATDSPDDAAGDDHSALCAGTGRHLSSRGRGRILLMDDEWKILKSMGALLGLKGYRVNFASDGERAISLYREALGTCSGYDVVIMDLTIPGGMGGVEAIRKLRELDPNVKALVSSGYSSEPVISRYRDYGFQGAVKKPYEIEELLYSIDSLINRDPGQQGGPAS